MNHNEDRLTRRQRKRRNQKANGHIFASTSWKRYPWAQAYRNRINQLKEYCRVCLEVSNELTFDHIIPVSRGGKGKRDNLTILCVKCQQDKGNTFWGHLISLQEEEAMTKQPRNGTPYVRKIRAPFSPEQMRIEMGIEKPEPLTQRIVVPPLTDKTPVSSGTGATPKLIDHSPHGRIDRLEAQLGEAARMQAQLERDLRVAFDRIKVLEDSQGVVVTGPDPIYAQIMDLLKSVNGLKMNSGSIASNIGSNSVKVGDKLRTLVTRGLIRTEKLEGASQMYWWEAPQENAEVK